MHSLYRSVAVQGCPESAQIPCASSLAVPEDSAGFDHPIFSESIRLIRQALAASVLEPFTPLEQEVLLRLIHSSGDLSLALDLRILGLTLLTVLRGTGVHAPGQATMAPFQGSPSSPGSVSRGSSPP